MSNFTHFFRNLEEGALEGASFHYGSKRGDGETRRVKGAAVTCHPSKPLKFAEDHWARAGDPGLQMYQLGAFGRTFCILDGDHLTILLENTDLDVWEHVPRNIDRVKAFVVFGGRAFVPPEIYSHEFRDTVDAMLRKLEKLWGRENLLFCAMQYEATNPEGTEKRVEVRFDHLLPPSALPAFWAVVRREWPCSITAEFVEPFPSVQGASWTLPETAETTCNGIDDPEFWHLVSPVSGDGEDQEDAEPREDAVPREEVVASGEIAPEWTRFCNEWFSEAPLTLDVKVVTGGKSDMLYYPTLVSNRVEVTSNVITCDDGHPATIALDISEESIMLTCEEGCVPAGTFLRAMKGSVVQSGGNSELTRKYETALDVFALHFGKDKKLEEMLERHALVGDKIYSKTHGARAIYHSEEEKVTRGLYRSQYYFAIEKRNKEGKEAEDDDYTYRFHRVQSCEKLFQNDFQHHPDKTVAIGTFFRPLPYTEMLEEQCDSPDPYSFRIEYGKLNNFCTPPAMCIEGTGVAEEDVREAEFIMQAYTDLLSPEDLGYFLDWVCYLLRYGRTYVLCAFMGDEGSGKSALMDSVGAFWKPHVVTVAKKKVVEEMFNSHLTTAVMVLIDDVEKVSRETIYTLVTASEISERKMRTDRSQKGLHCSVMASFNKNDNPFPLSGSGEEQRRYLLLDINNTRQNDVVYWKRFYDAVKNPGAIRHLAHMILLREDNFQRGHARETAALQRLRVESLPTVAWLGDFLCEQRYVTVEDLSGGNVPRTAKEYPKKDHHWYVWRGWEKEKRATSRMLSVSQLFRFYADLTEDATARKPFYALLRKVLRPKTRQIAGVLCVETDTWLNCVQRFLDLYPHDGLRALTGDTVPTLLRGGFIQEPEKVLGGGEEEGGEKDTE